MITIEKLINVERYIITCSNSPEGIDCSSDRRISFDEDEFLELKKVVGEYEI